MGLFSRIFGSNTAAENPGPAASAPPSAARRAYQNSPRYWSSEAEAEERRYYESASHLVAPNRGPSRTDWFEAVDLIFRGWTANGGNTNVQQDHLREILLRYAICGVDATEALAKMVEAHQRLLHEGPANPGHERNEKYFEADAANLAAIMFETAQRCGQWNLVESAFPRFLEDCTLVEPGALSPMSHSWRATLISQGW